VDTGAPLPSADGIPAGLPAKMVRYRIGAVLGRAERCHQGGRATGKAQVVLTFQPDGKVSDVRVEGEPIASAPVASCIIAHAQSIILPPFDGKAFTYRYPITLR
jgi:hypothetical protein